jgi:hypothetical protein
MIMSAARPATWGEEKEVPDSAVYKDDGIFEQLQMSTPGADTSILPKFEKSALLSLLSVAATLMTVEYPAGYHTVELSFPAAATHTQ